MDGPVGVGRRSGEHGRQGTVPGQRIRGASVALGQVRGGVCASLRGGAAVGQRTGAVLRLLQRRSSAPIVGVPNARGGLRVRSLVGVMRKHSVRPRTTSAGGKAVRGGKECLGSRPRESGKERDNGVILSTK